MSKRSSPGAEKQSFSVSQPDSCTTDSDRGNAMYELDATADMLVLTPKLEPANAAPPKETVIEVVLVKAVLDGDRDGFGRLYDLYAPLVHGILVARVPRGEVDDLVQDIFLHAFKKLHTLRDWAAFGPWIAMIARNRAVDFHRRSRETTEITEDLRSSDCSPSRANEILDLIRGLPDAYRETLVFRLAEGMTEPEIATRTGLTPTSVRANLHPTTQLMRVKSTFTERGC